MADITPIDIFDPRGRVNRKGLALVAAILVGAQLGIYGTIYATGTPLPPAADAMLSAALGWVAVAAVTKRMHDLGVSAVWLAWGAVASVVLAIAVAAAIVFCLGEDAVLPGASGYWLVATSVFAPAIAATFWLHFAPGEIASNRFGPAPGASGFSRSPAANLAQSA